MKRPTERYRRTTTTRWRAGLVLSYLYDLGSETGHQFCVKQLVLLAIRSSSSSLTLWLSAFLHPVPLAAASSSRRPSRSSVRAKARRVRLRGRLKRFLRSDWRLRRRVEEGYGEGEEEGGVHCAGR